MLKTKQHPPFEWMLFSKEVKFQGLHVESPITGTQYGLGSSIRQYAVYIQLIRSHHKVDMDQAYIAAPCFEIRIGQTAHL